MSYTEEEIKKYLEIIKDYNINISPEKSNLKAKCTNCENSTSFTIDYGYKICDECGVANGHVLGFYDNKLMEIDNHVMEILNKEYNRKRMISIVYLIKKLLDEMEGESNKASKLIYLNISPETLNNYENWWDSYKSLKPD